MIKPATRKTLLLLVSFGCLTFLVVLLLNPSLARDRKPPAGDVERAAWLARHPAQWHAASELTDAALDADVARRRELWRASYELASHLAPLRQNPRAGFVRGGLFHWYELDAADRKRVLDAAVPLLREPAFFHKMLRPLWQLTHDFGYLRRVAPDTIDARRALLDLAASTGRFADYRSLRSELKTRTLAEFERRRRDAAIADLLALLPPRFDMGDEPLVHAALEEIDRNPLPASDDGRLQRILEFSIRHRLQPIGGLRPLITAPGRAKDVLRARAALAMGDPGLATQIEISTAVTGDPEWVPYHLDRALWEAENGTPELAESHLTRAAFSGFTDAVRSTAAEVYSRIQKPQEAERFRAELRARSGALVWTGTCDGGELCGTTAATARTYAKEGETIPITLTRVASDATPPYVEVYLDDVLVDEGEIAATTNWKLEAAEAGMHRIELRLVNPVDRNGAQRRVRLS